MRSFWTKCVVALLMLALLGGNALAVHLPGALQNDRDCPEAQADAGIAPHHRHQHRHCPAGDAACCCDCLGCVSAALLVPQASAGPVDMPALVIRPALAAALAERAPIPEPEPPKPIALS